LVAEAAMEEKNGSSKKVKLVFTRRKARTTNRGTMT
jgi:hypothetical protein